MTAALFVRHLTHQHTLIVMFGRHRGHAAFDVCFAGKVTGQGRVEIPQQLSQRFTPHPVGGLLSVPPEAPLYLVLVDVVKDTSGEETRQHFKHWWARCKPSLPGKGNSTYGSNPCCKLTLQVNHLVS